jgi:hypothetical protein
VPSDPPEKRPPDARSLPNLRWPTLGGKQVWGDRLLFRGWRIQRNELTGHHRLLDPEDVRHAWGSFASCRRTLEDLKTERGLAPMQGSVVLLLHGLFRARASMTSLQTALREEGGIEAYGVGYPSAITSLSDQADGLASVLRHLDGVTEIHFVAYSLGALVLRTLLGRGVPDPRIGRIVMIGPPNGGAQLAGRLTPPFAGARMKRSAVYELAAGWADVEPRLGMPPGEFGILAGGRGAEGGNNPLLEGDDDWIVTVDATRLAGARDFRVVPCWHAFLTRDPRVQAYTISFLRHGYFESEATRRPL